MSEKNYGLANGVRNVMRHEARKVPRACLHIPITCPKFGTEAPSSEELLSLALERRFKMIKLLHLSPLLKSGQTDMITNVIGNIQKVLEQIQRCPTRLFNLHFLKRFHLNLSPWIGRNILSTCRFLYEILKSHFASLLLFLWEKMGLENQRY